MKAISAIGIGLAIGAILFASVMEGSSPMTFFNLPALLIVCGGTLGATMAGTSVERIKSIPQGFKRAMGTEKPDLAGRVKLMVEYAEKARRDGLLALDSELDQLEDEFTRRGFQLVVDGVDPEIVREVLENEIDGIEGHNKGNLEPFEKAGGYAPTIGILGCVLALIHVLQNLSAPATLGPSISVAFVATLYGVGAANLIFYPVGAKLKELNAQEVELYTVTIEGILAVQAGDNPRVVADKLRGFVPPDERGALDGDSGSAASSASEPEPAAAAA